MRSRVVSCAVVVTGLVTSLTALVPEASAADKTPTDLTVLLAAPHPGALRTLARRPGLTRTERRAELQPLLPQGDDRSDVVAQLEDEGFTVTGVDTWTITATAPAGTVEDALGTPTRSGDLSESDQLGPAVASVVTEDDEPDLRPLATTPTSGADYRNAYAPVGGQASTGADDAASTVATIQLSDWDSADLSYYATRVLGVRDPVASGQYSEVAVDGGPTDSTGSGEVDLDQEAILATAPSARQRAYLAPNTLAGFADAYSTVAAEAAARRTTAVSVSWGGCESSWSAAATRTMENVLASVNAAGVTAFSSTGDQGIYDCAYLDDPSPTDSVASVDYPASSPQVVGVGGTALRATTSPASANTGSNWSETGWSCGNLAGCTQTSGGSGGGASAKFAKPTYQSGLPGGFGASSRRLVPDVSAVGDPSTGFVAYTRSGRGVTTGGTSLSAPVAAASFANALGDARVTSHPGDIHPALYRAQAENASGVFRDVTSGQNGATVNRGSDPSVYASAGYDTVTGLGSVYWPALLAYLDVTTGETSNSQPGDVRPARLTSSAPRVTGTRRVGRVLRVDRGRWTAGTSLSQVWYVGGRAVSRSTAVRLTGSARGKRVVVKVTGRKAGYSTLTRTSAATARIRRR